MDEKPVGGGGEEGESSRVHLLPFHLSFLVRRVIVFLQVFFLSVGLVGRIDNINKRYLHFPFLVLQNG